MMKIDLYKKIKFLVVFLLLICAFTLSAQTPKTQVKPKTTAPTTVKKPAVKPQPKANTGTALSPKADIPVDSEILLTEMPANAWIDESLTISPDGKHYAYIKKYNEKMSMVIDGKEGKEYEEILSYGSTFSPDSKRFAYLAYMGKSRFVVIDNKEEKQYDNIQMFPKFSPDSKHLVYSAVLNKKGFLVFDGKEGKQYKDMTLTGVFSPNSNRFAYFAYTNDDKYVLVLDGVEQKKFTEVSRFVEFSSDSKHVLYAGFDGSISLNFNTDRGASTVRKGNYKLVLDTTIVGTSYHIGYIKFNPINTSYIYSAKNESDKCFLVNSNSGGKASLSAFNPVYYQLIFDPIYSPDGKEIAFGAIKANDKECVVLNGIENKEYDEIDNLKFSPDGKQIAYVAKQADGIKFVVQNLLEGQSYNRIYSLVFSPDSKNIAYAAEKEKKTTVVVNGKESKFYDKVLSAGNHLVNFNSQNRVYYVVLEQNKLYYIEKSIQSNK